DAWRAEFGDEAERPRCAKLLRSGVVIFDLDYDAILAAMYALSVSAVGDCYLCVPPDPGIEAIALGASESSLPGTTPAEALHTFTLDSRDSCCFFRDSTTLTPLTAPVPVRLADPSGGPLLARSSTILPCPAVPSSSLSCLHLPSFSTNLVSASGPVAPPCSCRLLSHQTLLWHRRLGHPSLPRLRGMHSRLLVSSLPRSLPPLPPSPAPPCLPCVEGRQRAAPHSPHGRVGPSLRLWTGPQVILSAVRLQLRERLHHDLPVMCLHSDRGGEFSSDLLQDFCRGEGILQSFMLPASPQQNGIAERRIGLVMEVARTSMIHAAAPHFLWPFAVRYAVHQLNLWPRVSLPETLPTLCWTVEVGDAWWSRSGALVPLFAMLLPPHLAPCLPLSVPFYRLFPYHSAPPPPPLLFLAPGPPPADPLPPQGPAPSGVSQVDPLPCTVPFEVAVDSGAARGAASGGAASRVAEPAGAEPGGAEPEGLEPGGAESEGAESRGAEPRGTASSRGSASASPRMSPRSEPLSPQKLRELFAQRTRLRSGAAKAGDTGVRGVGATSLGGAGVTPGAGGNKGAAAAVRGAARTRGAGTGGAGAGGIGIGDAGPGGAGAGDTGAVDPRAGGAGAGGAVSGGTGAGGTVRPRLYFVPLFQQVLGFPFYWPYSSLLVSTA
ncbi:unnamed protein product, partial [Closterium sp. NIES-53]